MSFFIKICGVTRPEDAALASELGVQAVGLNFWRGSRRFVEDEVARNILAALAPGVQRVGVFVNAHPLVVTETMADLALDFVQLHGDERISEWTDIEPDRLIRAFRISDETSFKDAPAWQARLFIYDAAVGGSGQVAPWALIARQARRPFLLAGGLSPDNVADGIRATRPDGVDVASGIESAPGKKDHKKMREFVARARQTASQLGLDGAVSDR